MKVSYSGDERDMAELLALLIRGEIPVIAFTREEGSLEEVFMEVTKGFEE